MQLDPLARIPYSNLPMLYAQQGQNDVAIKLWLDAIEIHPEWPIPYQYVAGHLLGLGRLDEAFAWNLAAQALSTDPNLDGNIGIGVYLEFGDYDKVRAIFNDLPASHPLAGVVAAFSLYLDADYKGALAVFVDHIENGDVTPPFIYAIAADVALLAGDFARARDYLLRQSPILDSDSKLKADRFTVGPMVRLAYIELQSGNTEKGFAMLRETLPVVQSLPRLGMFGQGIRDVQILCLLGRTDAALLTLQSAVSEGFRSSAPFNDWVLAIDPFLEVLRDDPRFTQVLNELDALNEAMHQRLLQAEQSGDWESLRSLAKSG
jgi:tetratricopeptide (TPR) repeat protein